MRETIANNGNENGAEKQSRAKEAVAFVGSALAATALIFALANGGKANADNSAPCNDEAIDECVTGSTLVKPPTTEAPPTTEEPTPTTPTTEEPIVTTTTTEAPTTTEPIVTTTIEVPEATTTTTAIAPPETIYIEVTPETVPPRLDAPARTN